MGGALLSEGAYHISVSFEGVLIEGNMALMNKCMQPERERERARERDRHRMRVRVITTSFMKVFARSSNLLILPS